MSYTLDDYGIICLEYETDLNPNIERSHHQLAIDSNDPTPDVDLALATAQFYGIDVAQAGEIL